MKTPLVGTWRLVSLEHRSSNGIVSYPWGPDAEGYITYTDDGYMFVAVMSANRAKFMSGDIKDGSAEEKAAAFDGYLSYCGTYDSQSDRVIHHVRASLFPNRVNADQVRFVKIEGNRLSLTSPPILSGGIQKTAHAIWERT